MNNTKIAERMAVTMHEAIRLLHKAQPDGARLATRAIQKTLQTLPRDRVGAREAAPSTVDQTRPQSTSVIRSFADGAPGASLNDLRTPLDPITAPLISHNSRPTPTGKPHPESPGRFIDGSYENSFGARTYKLYIPTSFCGQPLPLLVMLHGCTQDSVDFAFGTRMNEIAEEINCLVLYPSQAQFANSSRCWNWFKTSHQQRDRGEPSILAEMTREIVKTFHNDENKVFVAGMSAGGAMAMILAATYPDLFSAAGVHSGLPYGAAYDLPSALAAMRQGAIECTPCTGLIPVIVFHGDQDKTVHPGNGAQIVAQLRPRSLAAQPEACSSQRHTVPGGRTYSRTVYRDANGHIGAEYWVIEKGGHAWSGGSTRGSHTDPKGPDASCEMMRFFLAREKSREM